MNFPRQFGWQLILVVIILASLAGCADANHRKQAFLESGIKYFDNHKYQEAVIQFRSAIQIDPKFAPAHYQLARSYLAANNPSAAYREFYQTVDLDPANVDAKLNLAKLLLENKQFGEAETIANAVLKIDPKNAEAHTILGEKNVLTHDLTNALTEMKRAVDLAPQRVEGYAAVGSVYLAQGKVQDAEAVYRKAIEVNPDSAQAYVALGQFHYSQRQMAQAEGALRTACGKDPHAIVPRLLLGKIYGVTGQLKDAEDTYVQLKQLAPDDPRAYRALGDFYVSSGQKEKAVSEFQSLTQKKPNDLHVQTYLMESLLDLNRFRDATPLIEKALGKAGDDPRILLASGRLLISEGRYPEAIERLQKMIRVSPNSGNAYYFLGMAQKDVGLLEAAKTSFSAALKLSPELTPASSALAGVDVAIGDHNEALRMADKTLAAHPTSISGHIAKARALIARGDIPHGESELQAALSGDPASLPALAMLLKLSVAKGKLQDVNQRLSRLVDQYPQNAGLHFLLALSYFSLKDLQKAETGARQTLALNPSTPDAWTLLANIDVARGDNGKAEADLRNAIAAQPRNVSNYVALGVHFEKQNKWDDAKKLFEKAHQMEPAAPNIAAELAFLYLEHGGDVNVAVSLAQTARQRLPDAPMTADALGWAYFKLGSSDLAIAQLKESAAKVPDNPVYQYHLGMAYLGARKPEMAAQSLRLALKGDPHFPGAANARAALDQIAHGKY